MRQDPLERLGIRAALMLGFGLGLGLWILTGWSFTRQLSTLEQRGSEVTATYINGQELLSTVRAQLNASSIILRDALLNPDQGARESYRARLNNSYASIDRALDGYRPVMSQTESEKRLARLRGEIAEFRRATLQILQDDSSNVSRLDRLNDATAPRRAAAVALSDEIRALNRQAYVEHRAATAVLHRDTEQRWLWSAGAALAANIVIALIAIFYAGRLEDRLRQRRQKDQDTARELQLLSSRIVSAQEEERRSIARELHDEVGQVLSAIKVDLTLAQRALEQHTLSAGALEDLQHVTDGALRTVRDLSQLLRPAVLDDLGLAAAVDSLLAGLARRHDVQVELVQSGAIERLTTDIEVTAFRVIQEALTNVARHAGANHCTVRLSGSADTLTLVVEDDGCGFAPADPLRGRVGLGLVGMRERVNEQGGSLEIDTAPGRGTRVRVSIPAVRRPETGDGAESADIAMAPDLEHPSVTHG